MDTKNTAVKIAKFAYSFAMDEVIGRLTATFMSGFVLPTIIFAVFSFVVGISLGWFFWA